VLNGVSFFFTFLVVPLNDHNFNIDKYDMHPTCVIGCSMDGPVTGPCLTR